MCLLFILLLTRHLSHLTNQPNPIICILAVRVCFFFIPFDVCVCYTKCIHCLWLMIGARLIAVFHLIRSHHFDSRVCVCALRAYLFLYSESTKGKSKSVSSLLFVALSGKQKSQHYQINQRTTVLVSQMNQMPAIVFISLRCVRKRFYTLFSFNPFVCNQKSLWQLFTMVSSG